MFDVEALVARMLRGDFADVQGHWLDDSVFVIAEETVAVAFGGAEGTNPIGTGGAVWTGSEVAMDTGRVSVLMAMPGSRSTILRGRTLTSLCAALTMNVAAGGTVLQREDIPVVQGAFQARDPGGSVDGQFYGSGHGEEGGVFERDVLLGAFGESR